ncbi:hypothetical protein PHJA_001309200 [Phtheirospermum japonicum]|uniref:DC1 domain-containing protein n=1 Tax=Phtheirospermum japonicum TaxID=374723 RepID=A0A830C0H3_9LAMI|nr:hypothetical protein PHJA_001309200 [Phtheirospermum japonicum]
MEYKHFSHKHSLVLHNIQAGQQFQCHGCNQACTRNSIFACWPCNFFLHDHCGNANRYVKHPSHPPHPLVLFPAPTYCSGSFLCNGCGAPGSAFSYTCALCEVDLHVHCAYLPPRVAHKAHPHELRLDLRPLPDKKGTNCKICTREMGCKHWSYICERAECDFRAHTYCATSEVKLGLYQDDEADEQNTVVYQIQGSGEDVLAQMFRIQMQLQMAQQT